MLAMPKLAGAPRDRRGSIEAAGTGGEWQANVETRRLDDEGPNDIGFIKIGVEGHEAEALAGAAQVIQRYRPTLVVEMRRTALAGQ